MNAAYLPLYEFLNTLPEPETPEEVAAVSYSNYLDDISMVLVGYRLEHHLNQTQLAEQLSCSQSLVSAYESGARNISAEKLCELMAKIGKRVTLNIEDANASATLLPGSNPLFPDSKIIDKTLCAS